MVSVNTSYSDFSAGEISPKIYGRFDIQIFYKSGRRVRNFIPETVGGAKYRTGTYFAAQTAGNSAACLTTFVYTDTIAFGLEFTPLRLRFYRNDSQVRHAAQAITGITQANPAVVTYVGADTFSNGDSVWIDNVVGMTEVNGQEYVVAGVNTAANTFQLQGINSTGFGAYTSGGTVEKIVQVTTPYTANDLFQLKFAQDNDILYIAHPLYNPQKLTYVSPTTWTLAAHSPIRKTRQPGVLISAISQANPAVVTYTGSDIFVNGDVVYIDNCSGMTQLNGREFTVAGVNTAANTFQLSGEDSSGYNAYSGGGLVRRITSAAVPFLSASNYPAAVGFYEQRLVYAGSINNPNKIWFSVTGEPDDFSLQQGITAEIDDGMEYVVSGNATKITWLKGTEKFLAVGALNDVLQVTGGIDGVITSQSISIKPSNSFGAYDIMPIGRGNQIFYVQNNGLTLRSFEYNFEKDSYIPTDRNTIADHITESGIKQIDFQEARPNIVWGVRNDGALIGMTIEEQEAVSGWHYHDTNGQFISVASLPRSNKYDQLWVCVKRTVNGVDKYFVEFFTDETTYPRRENFVSGTEVEDYAKYQNSLFESQKQYIHVDSAISYYGDSIGTAAGASVTPAATTGTSVVFTASASVFTASMVGRRIIRKSITGAEYGVAVITGYTSATSVTCSILEAFNGVSAMPAGQWYLTTNQVSGAGHLNGKLVTVVGDGGQLPAVTVSNGVATLAEQASVVHIGLPYIGWLETNELEGGGVNGTAQTKRKNVYGIGFRFLDTLYAEYGVSYYSMSLIEMRTTAMRMDRPPELFTGDTFEQLPTKLNDVRDGGWSRSIRAIVCQRNPFPCKVQLIVPYFAVSN
jgi:hypothetical protein